MRRRARVAGAALGAIALVAACSSGSSFVAPHHKVLRNGPDVPLATACRTQARTKQPPAQTTPPPNPQAAPKFTDVTTQVGLDYCQGERRNPPNCLFSRASVEARFPKFNASDPIFASKDACTPERETGGVAVGDYNNDGWPDLYVTRLDGPGILYENVHGHFRDVTSIAHLNVLHDPSNGAQWADLDNDGYLDLIVTTIAGRRLYVFMNDGHGHFSEEAIPRGLAMPASSPLAVQSVNVGDFDNDGYVDVDVTEWRIFGFGEAPSRARLFRNLGKKHPGYFEDVTKSAGVDMSRPLVPAWSFSSAISDLDGDGKPDLYVASDFGTSKLFWNDGNGHFSDGTRAASVGTEENGMGLTIGDYDRDGRPDIFVTSIYDPTERCQGECTYGRTGNRLYRNLGNRHFADATSAAGVRNAGWGWGTAFIDATNSGWLGLVATSGIDYPAFPSDQFLDGPTRMWWQATPGHFVDVAQFAGMTQPGPGKGLAVLDYDRDGRMDVVIVRDGSTPVLYRNVTPQSGHWLGVQLVGRDHRNVIGSVVTLDIAGQKPETFWYGSVSHFLGQSDPAVHAGLGAARRVNKLTVHWADGHQTTLHNLAVDRMMTIDESHG
ncbi:MAG TPA: CRTAC1 family protein [Acidimicrobiia bacterium]|jgi:hypothetical protein